MGFLDEVKQAQASTQYGKRCSVCKIIGDWKEKGQEKDSKELATALKNSTVSHAAISAALLARGESVNVHRVGNCRRLHHGVMLKAG